MGRYLLTVNRVTKETSRQRRQRIPIYNKMSDRLLESPVLLGE